MTSPLRSVEEIAREILHGEKMSSGCYSRIKVLIIESLSTERNRAELAEARIKAQVSEIADLVRKNEALSDGDGG